MTIKSASLTVNGLDVFRKELTKMDGEWVDQLKDANKEVADHVVGTAKSRAAFSPLTRKAAQSLKAGRQAARAVITGGGARFPFFGGAEFGSIQHKQFKAWRGSDRSAGYFLYPAIRADSDWILDRYSDVVADISDRAFPS